jgi:hypothetical protein
MYLLVKKKMTKLMLYIYIKVKIKFHPVAGHEGPEGK